MDTYETALLAHLKQDRKCEHKTANSNCSGIQILNSFISAEPDVNSRDIHNNNAILLGVERGCVHEVKALISAGADVNTKIIGASVLYCAIRRGAVESAEELLKAGADVNSKTFEKCTPLMRAVRSGCDKCIRLLLKYGAYVNEKDVQGYNAFDFLLKPNEEIFYLLYAAGEETMDEKGVSRVIYSEKPNNLVDENTQLVLLCRKRIRSHLLKLDAHNNLFLRISNLNLPTKIIEYLLIDMSL